MIEDIAAKEVWVFMWAGAGGLVLAWVIEEMYCRLLEYSSWMAKNCASVH